MARGAARAASGWRPRDDSRARVAPGSSRQRGPATRSSTTGSVATGSSGRRLADHRRRRRSGRGARAETEPAEPVLIDGLTLWLSTLLGDGTPPIDPILDGPVAAAYAAIDARPGPVVVVSDEVGSGIVPMHPNARAYRDLVGIAHQRLAAMADEAYLFVAGLPVTLKGPAMTDDVDTLRIGRRGVALAAGPLDDGGGPARPPRASTR